MGGELVYCFYCNDVFVRVALTAQVYYCGFYPSREM